MGREFVEIFDEWIHTYDATVTGEDPEYRDVFEGYENILDEVASKAVGTVLEFGAGTGNLTAKLLDNGLNVICIEPNAAMRQIVSNRFPTINSIDGDLLDFEIEDVQIYSIVSTYVFHHLTDEEKEAALKKYAKLLATNGKVVFADTVFTTEEAMQIQIDKERARGFHNVADDLEREYYTTLPKLMKVFLEAQFEVDFKQLNDYVWLMEAIKK